MASLLFACLLAAALPSCEARDTGSRLEKEHKSEKGRRSQMDEIDIVAGKSMGAVRLGAKVSELPKDATLSGPAGEHNGIQFLIVDGKVEDWIGNVRALKSGIRFAGRTIAQNTPIEDLKRILGPCRKVEGVKGGVFLNCESGLTLGLDFEERGDFVQLRLKPR